MARRVNRWLAPRAGETGREGRPDDEEDEQTLERHRRREVGGDGLAAVAEADRLAAEPGLEPDEGDRADRAEDEGAAVAMVDDRKRR